MFIWHDTAGFQDNEPLMRALSKLVYLNNPNLILFVGEALVGNDAVDQLSKFNQVWLYINIFVQLQFCFCFSFAYISVIEPIYFIAEISRPLNISHTQIDRWDLAHQVWHYWW